MDWKRYFMGINHRTNGIFIGTGDLRKDGTIKYTNKSDDRTYEIVNVVGQMMRLKLDKQDDKPYFGYELPRIGKLVLIKPGYEFAVKKKSRNNATKLLTDV